MKQKILIVEDDRAISTGLCDLLTGEGYAVISADTGPRALHLFEEESPDLILLDIMIPGMNGYDVCRTIRQSDAVIPILMLTAKGQEIDKVIGLEIGADDYIVKPFGIHELLARIHAAFRRRHASDMQIPSEMSFGDITIDPKTFEGTCRGTPHSFTQRELRLLQLFLDHDGEVLHRFVILDKIWGIRYEGTTRTLDQHIAKLRQKIEKDPSNPRYIKTVHGTGYRFCSGG